MNNKENTEVFNAFDKKIFKTIGTNKFLIADMIQELTKKQFAHLKKAMISYGIEGLTLEKFENEWKNALQSDRNESKPVNHEKTLEVRLQTLFNQIDIDGSGYITWEEFCEVLFLTTRYTNSNFKTYKEASIQISVEKNEILRLKYIKSAQFLSSFGQDNILNFWRSDRESGTLSHQGSIPLHVEITDIMDLPEREEYVCSLMDRSIAFFDANSLQKKQIVNCYSPQTCLEHVGRKKEFFLSGDVDGLVHIWSVDKHQVIKTLGARIQTNNQWTNEIRSNSPKSQNQKPAKNNNNEKEKNYVSPGEKKMGGPIISTPTPEILQQFASGNLIHHTDVVTSLKYVSDNDSIASGSLDKSIIYWDPSTGVGKEKRSGIHSRGITDLAYSNTHRILISVAGEIKFFAWSSLTKNPIHCFNSGHSSPLIGVYSSSTTPEFITVDTSGESIIWDLRTLKPIQFLKPEKKLDNDKTAAKTFTVDESDGSIFVCGNKNMILYKSIDNIRVGTINFPVPLISYNSIYKLLVTPSKNCLLFWNSFSGEFHSKVVCKEDEVVGSVWAEKQKMIVTSNLEGQIQMFSVLNQQLVDILPIDEEVVTLYSFTHPEQDVSVVLVLTNQPRIVTIEASNKLCFIRKTKPQIAQKRFKPMTSQKSKSPSSFRVAEKSKSFGVPEKSKSPSFRLPELQKLSMKRNLKSRIEQINEQATFSVFSEEMQQLYICSKFEIERIDVKNLISGAGLSLASETINLEPNDSTIFPIPFPLKVLEIAAAWNVAILSDGENIYFFSLQAFSCICKVRLGSFVDQDIYKIHAVIPDEEIVLIMPKRILAIKVRTIFQKVLERNELSELTNKKKLFNYSNRYTVVLAEEPKTLNSSPRQSPIHTNMKKNDKSMFSNDSIKLEKLGKKPNILYTCYDMTTKKKVSIKFYHISKKESFDFDVSLLDSLNSSNSRCVPKMLASFEPSKSNNFIGAIVLEHANKNLVTELPSVFASDSQNDDYDVMQRIVGIAALFQTELQKFGLYQYAPLHIDSFSMSERDKTWKIYHFDGIAKISGPNPRLESVPLMHTPPELLINYKNHEDYQKALQEDTKITYSPNYFTWYLGILAFAIMNQSISLFDAIISHEKLESTKLSEKYDKILQIIQNLHTQTTTITQPSNSRSFSLQNNSQSNILLDFEKLYPSIFNSSSDPVYRNLLIHTLKKDPSKRWNLDQTIQFLKSSIPMKHSTNNVSGNIDIDSEIQIKFPAILTEDPLTFAPEESKLFTLFKRDFNSEISTSINITNPKCLVISCWNNFDSCAEIHLIDLGSGKSVGILKNGNDEKKDWNWPEITTKSNLPKIVRFGDGIEDEERPVSVIKHSISEKDEESENETESETDDEKLTDYNEDLVKKVSKKENESSVELTTSLENPESSSLKISHEYDDDDVYLELQSRAFENYDLNQVLNVKVSPNGSFNLSGSYSSGMTPL